MADPKAGGGASGGSASYWSNLRRASETFADYLERRGSSRNTVIQYLSRVRPLEASGPGDAAIARAVELLTGEEGRAYAPKSRRMMKAAYLSWARFHGNDSMIAALGELKLPVAVRAKAQVPLPPAVYRAVRDGIVAADYLPDPVRACLGLMACRGLRRGDVLRMQRDEINQALKQSVLSYLVKGGRRLEIGVLKGWRDYLEILARKNSWKVVHELVSTSPRGAEQVIPTALRRVAENVELGDDVEVADVRCHILRRSYAVMFYEACGRDPVKLQNHLGWANVSTALSYVDFARRDELDAIADKMMG